MQILIVEDSATLRAHMKKMVTQLGHTPLFANSGVEALQMVGSTQFDFVIMDVEMPGLDGFETTSLMREALGERWVPIIFSTSHDGDDKVLAGIEAGGDDYLIKPISTNLLKAKITSMQRLADMHQQLKLLNSELEELSQFDGLTRLFNRRTFEDKAEQCMKDVRRFGKPCAMLMIDVDFFKQYNDYYGHLQGDECLKNIANMLRECSSRESDLVGRYGGEEFVILLPDTDQSGAILVAERIIASAEALGMEHSQSPIASHVTVSIGISCPSERCSLADLFSDADKNLYTAKDYGRNQFFCSLSSVSTLLLVDDCEQRLANLTENLQQLGNIITADSIEECLELAKEITPSVIILSSDEGHPAAESLQQRLQAHVRTSRIPVYYQRRDDNIDTASIGYYMQKQ